MQQFVRKASEMGVSSATVGTGDFDVQSTSDTPSVLLETYPSRFPYSDIAHKYCDTFP